MKRSLMAAFGAVMAMAAMNGSATMAATTTNTAVLQGAGTVNFTDLNGIDPNSSVFQFNWSQTPFTAFAEFSSAGAFVLTYDDYRPDEGNSNVSGFTFDRLDGAGGIAERFTTQGNFCAGAAGSIGGTCNLITSDTNSGGNADQALRPNSAAFILATVFGGGNYRLGFYDSSDPFQGSATFNVAAVPIPAALPLFLTAITGLGFASRRRRAA